MKNWKIDWESIPNSFDIIVFIFSERTLNFFHFIKKSSIAIWTPELRTDEIVLDSMY